MEKVNGIGGLFFKAKNPKELAIWYRDHLGISLTPQSYEPDDLPWEQEAGATIFQPFLEDTEYFGRREDVDGEFPRARPGCHGEAIASGGH